ncbi:uncharacterized protein METZ01_LOCUS200759 [marine metagenome]|uniref:SPOR domain-containing protein n=1 Tax=marine metagenome TaxID=408172 RepID=A0A382EBM9_9ZZZZ
MQGIAPDISQYLFALCLLIGIGQVKASDFETASTAYQSQNYAVAFEEFSELANAGDARAQTVLAIMHKYGESIQVDLERAFYWYQQAADQEYPPAQFNVGIMFLEGSGVPEDRNQAKYWLEKAASAGFERAADVLAEIAGGAIAFHDEEPITWSQQWNLRLPNQVRENSEQGLNRQYLVYRVQLGAMNTIEGAQRLWHQIVNKDAEFFSDLQPIFREALSSGREVVRLQVGPFNSHGAASQFCEDVLSHALSAGCLVLLTD